ncbi:unnamed protein product [Cylindrotheca closterium]|uniref:non-specific serine/threonine protein kinase n=1 Tax=Cylindrotheca closterium TaxID=2856 RepID=A0AAD2JJT1_9STRA|nr:unnamed protein product [Cylindrotheca closterium]
MTAATGPSSPDRNGSNNNDNNNPSSPVKIQDDEKTIGESVNTGGSGSSQLSDPLTKSRNELEMLQEEIRFSEELLNDGKDNKKTATATATAKTPPGSPDRASATIAEEASPSSATPPKEKEEAAAQTPVRHHRGPLAIDHAGNILEQGEEIEVEHDSDAPAKDPLVPPAEKAPSSPPTPKAANSPARSTASSGSAVWFSGIGTNDNKKEQVEEQEMSKGESTKNPATLNSFVSTRSEFDDELNTTMPETPTKSVDGRNTQERPAKLTKKMKLDPSAPDPLERMTNNHLSALFACLVIAVLGVIMFLVYVLTQPEIIPPTSAPTLSFMPSDLPSSAPTDWVPSATPTATPTIETMSPSDVPSSSPSESPSRAPSASPSMAPSTIPSSNPTERDPAEDLSFLIGTISQNLKDRIQNDVGSKQREAFEWLIRDPEFYAYDERKLIQRYVLALFSLEIRVPSPGRKLRGGERNLNWNALETWMQYTDECTWFTSYYLDRVGCDRTGTWKRLVLYNLDLQGTIPSELALLTRMETLILANHTIGGTIPPELSRLPLLEQIDLSGNQIVGRIPTEFGDLDRLQELYLHHNQIGNIIPAEFGRLTALRQLDASDNGIIGRLPFALGQMTALEELNLSNNRIGNSIPTEVGQMRALRRLDLSRNGLLGNIPFQLGLYNLRYIDLSSNQLVGTLPSRLGGLRDLLYLDVSRNPLSGPFPAEVCSLIRPYFWNATSGQSETISMFKASCATIGCSCCTDCVY